MNSPMVTLHIVSRVATPHNNSLVRALRRIAGWRVVTWYSVRSDPMYGWKDELGDSPDTRYLCDAGAKAALLREVLLRPKQQVLFVGYSEPIFRVLMTSLLILGRKFLYWTDHPQEPRRGFLRKLARKVAYGTLRLGAARVMVVGAHAVEWFAARGFRRELLLNFPIAIDLPAVDAHLGTREKLRTAYGVPAAGFFFVAGSRLTCEKGFDTLVEAVGLLPSDTRARIRVLIVGKGAEKSALQAQAERLGLGTVVVFADWLPSSEFEAVIAAADVFVHPSRFDAFGGGTLFSMAVGVPVIGSDGAGVVLERVEAGRNGMIFPKGDAGALAACLINFIGMDVAKRREWGRYARTTAERWTPDRNAAVLRGLVAGG